MRIRNTKKCLEPESEPPFCLEPTQIAPGPRTSQKSGGSEILLFRLNSAAGSEPGKKKKRGGHAAHADKGGLFFGSPVKFKSPVKNTGYVR